MKEGLSSYDWIVVNSSSGKDSLAMLDYVVKLARLENVMDRVVVVHADLGRVEWEGVPDLARTQAEHYGAAFRIVQAREDLLDHIERRGKWPSSFARYCTSDHKSGPVAKLITELAMSKWVKGGPPVRVLNCLGIRAEESPARAKKEPFRKDEKLSSGRRTVDIWYPIFHWKLQDVWDTIHASGAPYHKAYDLGMSRLSCIFCVFAPKSALLLAGHHNRNLLKEYVRAEESMGHTFRQGFTLKSVQDELDAGYVPCAMRDDDWNM